MLNFTQVDDLPSLLNIWIADVKTGQARRLVGPPELCVNSIFES